MADNANIDLLIVVIMVALIGLAALLLVGNELGARSRLGVGGKIALMGGLGLGVIAFTIKAGIIVYLNSLDPHDIEAVRSWEMFGAHRQLAMPGGAPDDPLSPTGIWDWQALPTSAREPADNRATPRKIALGKALFFDRRLSLDDSLSCASCHRLGEGGDDNSSVSTGIGGQKGGRNAPSVWNAAFLTRLFWDGRAASLEDQATGPIVNPVEMGMPSLFEVERKVRALEDYDAAFAAVFGGPQPVTIGNIAKAIAAFERTLITPDAPYDRFVLGDDRALTPQQLRGMALFQEIGCRNCHLDPTFSSAGSTKPFGVYRAFPINLDDPFVRKYDLLVDGQRAFYRVPSLRNVAHTGPYLHNGAVATLEEAVRVMAVSQLGKVLSDDPADDLAVTSVASGPEGGRRRLTLFQNRAMSHSEIADIAAFLRGLSSELREP